MCEVVYYKTPYSLNVWWYLLHKLKDEKTMIKVSKGDNFKGKTGIQGCGQNSWLQKL